MRDVMRWRLILAGAFLAPMALVKGAELYFNRALPQQAAAEQSAATSAAAERDLSIDELLSASSASRRALSDAERELLTYVQQVRQHKPTRSPLHLQIEIAETPEPIEEAPPEPVAPPALSVTVQAVMRASGGNIALINGESYQVGATIDDGRGTGGHWIIRDIDPSKRSVTFEHSSGAAEETRSVLR